MMRNLREVGFSTFYAGTAVEEFAYQNVDSISKSRPKKTKQIPIETVTELPLAVPVELPLRIIQESEISTAVKIQSAFRSYRIRNLVRKIAAIDRDSNHLRCVIQLQETVDSIRNNEIEKLKISEALMAFLLRLDEIPGIDPAVRELRRSVSRKIVELQEIVDSVCSEAVADWRNWYDASENDEFYGLEMFSADNLGLGCLEMLLKP